MSNTTTRYTVSIAVLLVCITATLQAEANPLDAFGFGTRSISMGGAMTAAVDDFSATYYNPAALARGEDLRIEMGYVYSAPSLEINGGDLNVDDNRGFQGGLVLPGKVFGRKFGVALGLFIPDDRVTRIRSLPESQPRYVLYDNRPQRVVISASAAFEVYKDLYLGGGVTFLTNTVGTLNLTGDIDFVESEKTTLLTGTDINFDAVRYPNAGLLYTPGNWSFGLSYRDAFKLTLDLGLDVLAQIYSGNIAIFEEDQRLAVTSFSTNLFSPRQVSAGAAYSNQSWLISVDLTWVQWSEFPSPTSKIELTLEGDDAITGLLDLPGPVEPIDPAFTDILVPRIGGEVLVLDTNHVDLRARAGYFFEPTPAPDQPASTNFVDNNKHGMSLGLGLELDGATDLFPKPIALDLAGQFIAIPSRTYSKTNPADPTGSYEASGHFLGTSLTAKFLF